MASCLTHPGSRDSPRAAESRKTELTSTQSQGATGPAATEPMPFPFLEKEAPDPSFFNCPSRQLKTSQFERQVTIKSWPSVSASTVANARFSHPTLALSSPLPATQDSLEILVPKPRIWLPHLLHLYPACQCQNPGKQSHSLRLGPLASNQGVVGGPL